MDDEEQFVKDYCREDELIQQKFPAPAFVFRAIEQIRKEMSTWARSQQIIREEARKDGYDI